MALLHLYHGSRAHTASGQLGEAKILVAPARSKVGDFVGEVLLARGDVAVMALYYMGRRRCVGSALVVKLVGALHKVKASDLEDGSMDCLRKNFALVMMCNHA